MNWNRRGDCCWYCGCGWDWDWDWDWDWEEAEKDDRPQAEQELARAESDWLEELSANDPPLKALLKRSMTVLLKMALDGGSGLEATTGLVTWEF